MAERPDKAIIVLFACLMSGHLCVWMPAWAAIPYRGWSVPAAPPANGQRCWPMAPSTTWAAVTNTRNSLDQAPTKERHLQRYQQMPRSPRLALTQPQRLCSTGDKLTVLPA